MWLTSEETGMKGKLRWQVFALWNHEFWRPRYLTQFQPNFYHIKTTSILFYTGTKLRTCLEIRKKSTIFVVFFKWIALILNLRIFFFHPPVGDSVHHPNFHPVQGVLLDSYVSGPSLNGDVMELQSLFCLSTFLVTLSVKIAYVFPSLYLFMLVIGTSILS